MTRADGTGPAPMPDERSDDHPDLAACTDEALIRASRSGQHDAYGVLVRRYQDLVVKVALLLGAADQAEDAAQEAFVSAWRALDRFSEGRPFRPWILQIVHNEVRNRQRTLLRRRRMWSQSADELLLPDAEASDVPALRADERRALYAAVGALPERQRLVVTYRYLLDLSEQETAAALRLPAGTVKSRLSRALGQLRADPAVAALLEASP
jgi:RNA polymerase sigma factor (sigma-70 family)